MEFLPKKMYLTKSEDFYQFCFLKSMEMWKDEKTEELCKF